MFTKIVVGYDGLEGGADALVLARALSAPTTALVLVHAYPFEDLPSRGSELDYDGLLRADAQQLLAEAAPADRPSTLVPVADLSPARALHDVAERHGADLIVIGSCRRSVLGRVLAGDVSRAVLHGAPCAVAVAPRDFRRHPGPFESIGVGFTDTAEARAALALAASLAGEHGASLRVLCASTTPAPYVPGFAYRFDVGDIRERAHLAAEQALEQAVAALPVAAEAEMIDDHAAQALENLSHHVSLLVAGSRGWGAARRVMLGSTTDHLSHHAACPLLVVPGPVAAAVQASPERTPEHSHA